MAKQLLIETRMNSLGLCESKEPHKNCLGTLYGPCADYNHPTRNGNFYSRKLWENTFNDDIIKESLEDRILIGELDHPGDRLESKAVNACIVMTDYEFHDDEGLLYGTFDILPTPNGKILKSLLDYGCKIGVSSRGEGDVVTESNQDVVDEDGYNFVGFDAVVLPAVKAAKPTLREGLDREGKALTLKESLTKEVETATTLAELNLIKSVVEATNLPDTDSLLESVNIKTQELTKGTTGSSDNLLEDLEKANLLIDELKNDSRKLKEELTTCKSRLNQQMRSRQRVMSESVSKKKFSKLQEQYNCSVFNLTKSSKEIESLKESLEKSRETVQGLRLEMRTTRSNADKLESRISSLEESLSRSQQVCKAKTEELNKLKSESKKSLSESMSNDSKLRESLSKTKKSLSETKKQYADLLNDYVSVKCKSCGVSVSDISLNESMTKEDIDKLVEATADRNDRLRSLPFRSDPLLESASKGTIKFNDAPSDTESDQTLAFLRQSFK